MAPNAQRATECNPTIHLLSWFERGIRVTGCLSAATFWIMNHGVAQTEEDMEALWTSLFLLPARQASFFRCCLAEVESGVTCCIASARLKNRHRRIGRNFHPSDSGLRVLQRDGVHPLTFDRSRFLVVRARKRLTRSEFADDGPWPAGA
jgi:hypothetical protein